MEGIAWLNISEKFDKYRSLFKTLKACMKQFCPLCSNQDIMVEETIKTRDIVYLYKWKINFDVSYLFKSKYIKLLKCHHCSFLFFDPFIPGDEKFYTFLQKDKDYYLDKKEEFLFAKKYINKNDKVLEIGCGKGAFKKIIDAEDYTGLDLCQNAQKLALENGVTILKETVQKHAVTNRNQYDVVCSFQVLEHIKEVQGFFESALICLKERGLLIISVPNNNSFLKFENNGIFNLPPHHYSRWSKMTFLKICTLTNLKVVNFHYDNLDEFHKRAFLKAVISNEIKKRIGYKSKSVDLSFGGFFIAGLSRILSELSQYGLSNKMLPIGHSITAVLKKKDTYYAEV